MNSKVTHISLLNELLVTCKNMLNELIRNSYKYS